METNYEKENEQFETWWNKITAKRAKAMADAGGRERCYKHKLR